MNIYLDLFLTFAKIGATTFGGGYAMLPMLTSETVKKRGWTTEAELMDYFAIGQCTPGVIAVNTATFVGMKTGGVRGAITATLGIILPSLIIITIIAGFIEQFSHLEVVANAFKGIRLAVCGLVTITIGKLVKKSSVDILSVLISILTFLAIIALNISPVLLVIGAAAIGILAKTHEARKAQDKKEGGDQ